MGSLFIITTFNFMKTPTRIILLLASLSGCLSASAQNDGHTYILNKQRQPLPYTNIVSLTTGKGTITDERGKFDHRQFASGDTLEWYSSCSGNNW